MSLFRLFESRDNVESPLVPITAASLVSLLGGTAVEAGVPVTPETSLQMSAVFRATSLVSSLAASMPMVPYRIGTKNPTVSAILANPHPDLTAFELWQLSYGHRCLWGNSYMQKVRNRAGQLTWLYPIQPFNVRVGRAKPIEANPSGKVFEVTTENGTLPYTPNEILHIPGFGYDGLTGVSRVRLAAQGIGTAIAAERYSGKLFGSGNLMSGVLQTEQRLENSQAEAIQKRWKAKHSGLDHAHDTVVLDSGAKFQPMTISSKDAEMLAARQFGVLEIGRFWGVPPFLMMETEKSTSWGCLPGDALVFTANGPKPIEQVEPGDEVWSYTGSSMALAKVTAFHETGHKPLLTIRTTSRELRLTANHRLPVRRYFGTAEGRGRGECRWETVEISAGDVREGDFLLVPHRVEGGDRTTAPNGRELTVQAMELCGLYTGDGSADGNRVEIAHGVDDPHMPYYRDAIRREFGVQPYCDKRGTRSRFSCIAARSLLECGFTGKAHTKRVPGWVFRLTEELRLAYLRGYLDADGGIARGVISFASVSKALLEDVRHLCISVGLPVGAVRLNRRAGVGTIRGKQHQSLDKFVLNLSTTAANHRLGSNHPSKLANLRSEPMRRALRYADGWEGGLGATAKVKRRESTPGGTWAVPDVKLQRVISIDRGQIAVPVYDITVAEHAHYVADGVVVHNTGLEQQATGFVVFDLHPQWLAPTEQRVSRDVATVGTEVRYDMDSLLRGDSAARAAFYNVMRQVGAYNADDIRERENMPPIPDGKGQTYLQPVNMQSLGAPSPATDGSTGGT